MEAGNQEDEVKIDENQIYGEMATFTESVFDEVSERQVLSTGTDIPTSDDGLDQIPMKYVAAEMDVCNAERETSSDSFKIDWAACRTEFVYSDLDTLENELGEIYAYYELSSLSYNFEMFHTHLGIKNIQNWFTSKPSEKLNFIEDLLDELELVDEFKRYDAVLAICYLIQGCWNDLETAAEQLQCIEDSVSLLLQCNGFWRIWSLLSSVMLQIEDDSMRWAWGINERIMENSLNVLCTITAIAMRKRDDFFIGEFLGEMKTAEGDVVFTTVLQNLGKFVVQLTSKNFLLKKLLLFARNLILLCVGDSDNLRKMKEELRVAAGLKPSKEDTILNCHKIDILQKNFGWTDLKDNISLMTVGELGEHARLIHESQKLCAIPSEDSYKSLPWTPKSSIEVLGTSLKSTHLYNIQPRIKIPITMQQRVNRLVEHLHVPLSAFQLQEEQLIKKYPKRFADEEKTFVERTEQMFLALLPVLETSLNALMMVLADATPVSNPAQLNPKNSKINSPFIPRYGGDAVYFIEDSTRQAEIIVKAVSAILILLLKHTKLNHIYQFECIASEIVAANYIPTALRFFNRDVTGHLCQLPVLQHPCCPFKAISVDLCLQCENDGMSSSADGLFGLSWRNTFSHVNLLRVLNKVVKGKPSRVLMLRMFKAHHCLKRCLNVKDSLFQQYTLKLLKHLCKFLDQDWKRSNQRVISAIYHKVRHRLLEDWIGEISPNKIRRRPEKPKAKKWPWDHNDDEIRLHHSIILYLSRKYNIRLPDAVDIEEQDDLENESVEIEIPMSFKETYERWIEEEVLCKNIAWDGLLSDRNSPQLV